MHTNKFNVGDLCFVISSEVSYSNIVCPECEGGIITTDKGSKFDCPRCDGTSSIVKADTYYWVEEVFITAIEIKTEIDETSSTTKVRYFFSVGSIRSYAFEEEIFAAKEEAEASIAMEIVKDKTKEN